MLKKLDFKKQLSISSIIAGTTVVLLSLAVFVLLGSPFTWSVLINYIILSLVLGLYLFTIMRLHYNLAFILFLIGYFFSFAVLFFAYAGGSQNGFTDLAGFIGFLLIIGLVMVLGVALEILMKTRTNLKEELKHSKTPNDYIEAEVVETKDTENTSK